MELKQFYVLLTKELQLLQKKTSERKISINSKIGKLELEPDKPISEINSPLKPFYYLANKSIANKSIENKDLGIRIQIDSEIPLGAGLGSSSACCVAGAAAIFKLFGNISREEVLKLAIEAERTIFENTSGADCTVCTYGGIMEYDKNKGFKKIEYEPNFQLVIINSNIEHSTQSMVSKVKEFENKNTEEFSRLSDLESKLVEDVLKLVKENKIQEIGQKMNQNQKYLENIGISNKELTKMIRVGQESSFGAKITGSGGGGCIFALTNESNLQNILKKFKDNNYECFSTKIDFKGLNTF